MLQQDNSLASCALSQPPFLRSFFTICNYNITNLLNNEGVFFSLFCDSLHFVNFMFCVGVKRGFFELFRLSLYPGICYDRHDVLIARKGGTSLPEKYKPTLYASYISFVVQAINNNLAPLFFVIFHEEFGLSFEMLGRLILVNFGTQLVVDIAAIRYADRIGYRKLAVWAHVLCTIGLMSLGILPIVMNSTNLALTIAVFLSAVGGGIIDIVASPIVESLPTDGKAAHMSLLHSFYCWGQMAVVIVTTLSIWLFGRGIWNYIPILWALIPLYNAFKFVRVPILPLVPDGKAMAVSDLLRSPLFFLALVLMMSAGASEITMSQWSSLFAETGLGVPKVVGDLVGPALFALFMAIGRTFYGVRGEKINLQTALQVCSLLCIACYAAAVFADSPLFALLGAAVCGLSVSLMWPGTLSLSAAKFPRGGTAMFAFLAIFGDIGASVGPWLTGVVSDWSQGSALIQEWGASRGLGLEQIGLRTGLLIGMIFPVLMFVGVTAMKKRTAEQPAAQARVEVS